MPNTKNRRNNSSKNSSKSTASTASTSSKITEDDDFGSLLVSIRTPSSSKKSTPKTPRPEFFEPLSPTPMTPPPPPPSPSPWEQVGMNESEFLAMQARVRAQMAETMRQNYIHNILADFESPSFWLNRIEQLEKEREYFNKKRSWSAADIIAVEKIDAEIQECDNQLDEMYAEGDRLECERD